MFHPSEVAALLGLDAERTALLGATPEELVAAIGPNASFYCRKWGLTEDGVAQPWSWNWSAILFTSYWMAYRKMYREMIVIWLSAVGPALLLMVGVILGEGVLPEAWMMFFVLMILLVVLGFYGVHAVFGNSLYRRRIVRLIEAARTPTKEPDERLEYLTKKGRVSQTAVVVLVTLSMLSNALGSIISAPG